MSVVYFVRREMSSDVRQLLMMFVETSETKIVPYLNIVLDAVWGPLMVAQWLRYCATNRKVAGSIPDGVIGIFH
jgi:hypothetical protein